MTQLGHIKTLFYPATIPYFLKRLLCDSTKLNNHYENMYTFIWMTLRVIPVLIIDCSIQLL